MDPTPSFVGFWSAQSPFAAQWALQQLRLWVGSHPWFAGTDTSSWFEVPAGQLEQLQTDYQQELTQLGLQLFSGQPPRLDDRRFASPHWQQPPFSALAAGYLLNSRYLTRLAEALPIDAPRARQRLLYLVEQTLAALAPSNHLASNPEALQRLVETGGASLLNGLQHLAEDLREGKLRHSNRDDFELGRDLATTPGAVVFENDLLQLIHYQPQTDTQYRRPLLIVPPAINKYYILDLRPENSLVRHALEQGHAVFLISWRNADQSIAAKTWDDYLQHGVITALRTVRAIAGERQVNCLGYCVGGTLLACALAVLAARGDHDIASLTLLTTFLDFADTGPIGVFVDEALVAWRERTIGGVDGNIGIFRGEDMGNTFAQLRPNELWWNYGVDKYLKGEKPKAFDLLFWNNDSTNLPGPMYCWYLRHTYLQNDLKSGQLTCCGVPLDLGAIRTPAYVLATEEDHIVPWQSAYASGALLKGPRRFVLGASGHIAGVINPPAKQKRQYWTADALPDSAEAWRAGASAQPGSWWPDWFAWLEPHAGERVPASGQCGSAEYPPLEAAPGRYVKA